ncbi:hypothetical protein L0337_01540 [candidate division KSB1 bacterium]|nr:hypothetical protein [candidate division KSB1 bacterium]
MFGVISRKNLANDAAMDEKLLDELIGALKDAAAFEQDEKIDLRVTRCSLLGVKALQKIKNFQAHRNRTRTEKFSK